ncbi:MAG: hypothetical protein IEMM0002_0826 [bacterium]|nr:MAG: hypothetical protein IEMM0002_0826 [bacterium]
MTEEKIEEEQLQPPKSESRVVDIVGWYEESWRIFKNSWHVYVLCALVFIVVNMMAQIVPFGGLVVGGPMMAGLYLVVSDLYSGKEFDLGRLFGGFAYFLPTFLAYIITTIFTTIGLFMLIIPGVIVASWYLFTYLFILDRDMDFWSAMEASRKIAFEDIVGFALFFLTMGVINIIGIIALFVGLLVTIPISLIVVFVAYGQLVGFKKLALR